MMRLKEVALSNASPEAKIAGLAVLLDKELLRLSEVVLNTKKLQGPQGEQGLQGPKGEQGDRGFDGANGKDGSDGKDGKDGHEGKDGVGVQDAKIDFDGSLVITLTNGREINAGDVVPEGVADKIKVIKSGGGNSQTVLDAIEEIQATIATYGTMATQNANAVAITGGSINGTTIGAVTPAAGTFTTLTATGQTDVGGSSALTMRFTQATSTVMRAAAVGASVAEIRWSVPSFHTFYTGSNATLSSEGAAQFRVNHTASAVNYVQVTGAATGGQPTILATGSDAAVGLTFNTKSVGTTRIQSNSISIARFTGATSAVNYLDLTHSITGQGPVISAQSISDSNTPLVLKSLGTGAIDLAAGSSGVNISNGGTVTAITRTAAGSGYTSIPSVAITAPTTAGGVQATATVAQMQIAGAAIQSGGTGYTVGNTLTIVGGTVVTSAATLTVTTVSAGVITGVSIGAFTNYTALPTNPVSVTGGTGSGATFNLTWAVISFTIGTAGSGYVEQPTVSFSGGGGSGAAAYATVGSIPTLKTVGSALSVYTPAGEQFRVQDSGATSANYWIAQGIGAGNSPYLIASGSDSNVGGFITSKGTGALALRSGSGGTQLQVAHTASAVNYVQVTGAATGSNPVISVQGSDANRALSFNTKGTGFYNFYSNGGSNFQFRIDSNATAVNYLQVAGSVASSAPVLSAQGSDTNIDLTLTPKGTGNVRFGTYTASVLAPTGYIEIKDSGGTTRRLLVG